MSIQFKLQIFKPSPKLLTALESQNLRYTKPDMMVHHINVGLGLSYGVVANSLTGCSEWFVWRNEVLVISDNAYGNTDIALRDAINEVYGK